MNELVREGSGILLRPHHTFSHEDAPVPVLGRYGNISASMSPEVCVSTGGAIYYNMHAMLSWLGVVVVVGGGGCVYCVFAGGVWVSL